MSDQVTPDPPKQYAARDAACAEWIERNYDALSSREFMIAKTAFCAGWSARKNARYRLVRRWREGQRK